MARYIDADELIKKIFPIGMVDDGNYTINAKAVKVAIDKMPTADVVPKSEVEKAKQEVAREIFEELYKSVASKVPMKIRPIFKDLDFEDGYTQGKCEALIEVFADITELKKKYESEKEK